MHHRGTEIIDIKHRAKLPPSIIEIKPRQLVLFSPSSTTPRPVDSRYLHLNFNCRERQSANRTPKLTDTRRPISIFSPVSRSIEHVGCAPFDPTTVSVKAGGNNNFLRYQCQNPSSPQAQSNFSPGRRYDPVHDSSMWRTHASSSNVPLRPPYSPPDVQQWPPAFVPGTNWQGWSSSGRPNFGDFNGRAPTFGDVQRDITAAFTDSALPQLPPFPEQPSGARQYLNAPWSYGNRYGNYPSSPQANQARNTRESFVSALRPSLLPAEQDTRPTGAASQLGTAGTTRLPSTSAVESLAEIFSHVPNGMAINRNSYPHPNRRHMSDPERSDGRFETQVRQQPHTLESESESTSDRENSSVFRLALTRHARDELYADMGNLDERAIAAMRGQISASKRLPTEEALGSLETLNAEDLKGKAKSCDICYNEFGISNPEGEVEQPTRLPKCKHIFGDKCIKKWFEDSNSCPYCRDQLPSQLVGKRASVDANIRAVQRERLRLIAQTALLEIDMLKANQRQNEDVLVEADLVMGDLVISQADQHRPDLPGPSKTIRNRNATTAPDYCAEATSSLPTGFRKRTSSADSTFSGIPQPLIPNFEFSRGSIASCGCWVWSCRCAAPRRYQAASWDEEMRAYEANTPTNARTPPPVVAGNIPAREGGQRNNTAPFSVVELISILVRATVQSLLYVSETKSFPPKLNTIPNYDTPPVFHQFNAGAPNVVARRWERSSGFCVAWTKRIFMRASQTAYTQDQSGFS
ncbi:zinc finger protein atl6 [Drepanopeziza brunnea f. sp. 'multigermtubi' MB_m1]|uniref:Zinc finger protein atl6 n=1 Tax=Marssonina brunnea f. sp. multigermtubi (strain MB_m1) TaxID=1072389 RepID=K1X6M9_MARBU|nr:zinc finger protein atl6 [Drepanopeziza brunnea f. sp. 'multigermtubi' MB_m1]EKD20746.1 zinc finger protein atl6 [Drepanopeziza brunnea f. sp. 'multigermtubi' MB_m1]